MSKYKICYEGFIYVEANNEDEAIDKYDMNDTIYEEREVTIVEEMDEFGIQI